MKTLLALAVLTLTSLALASSYPYKPNEYEMPIVCVNDECRVNKNDLTRLMKNNNAVMAKMRALAGKCYDASRS